MKNKKWMGTVILGDAVNEAHDIKGRFRRELLMAFNKDTDGRYTDDQIVETKIKMFGKPAISIEISEP